MRIQLRLKRPTQNNISELKKTLRFVALIAIPLCFVNSLVFVFIPERFLLHWYGSQ